MELPKVSNQTDIIERETKCDPEAISELAFLGKRHEGLDGKKYLTSFAVHVYVSERITHTEFIFFTQTADLRQLPENIAQEAVKELTRALMKRYGRKPARKTTDGKVRESEDSRL